MRARSRTSSTTIGVTLDDYMRPVNLLVLSNPTADYLRLLDELPKETNLIVGNKIEIFEPHAAQAEVLVNCMTPLAFFREVFMKSSGNPDGQEPEPGGARLP